MKKVLLIFLCLVVIATGVFAGGKKEAAEENKVLRLISWTGYAPADQLEKFKEETGITVEVTLSSNEEMISKLRATRGGGFDLAQPSQDRISSMVEQFGIYQPIDYSKVNTDQLDPSMLAATKKYTEVNGKSYAVPHVFGTSGLIVNRAKAPDVKDYKDLLDPKYTGRTAYRMKRPTLMAMGFSLGYDPFALYSDKAAYQKFLDEIGDVLIKAKPVVRNYWENGDALLESMRSGEVWAAMGWEQQAWKLYKENKDIDYVAPASGAMAWVDTFALPAKSENVEGAYKYINFILRPENAAGFTNVENYGTASKDAVKFLNPEAAANFSRCFTPEVMAKMNWYPTVPAGLEEMEGKTMDKIKAAK
ncbi:MAG: extracellular solute-binding protein [Spirochaetia bacterium]|jgi:spermidine/putrescine transport system substrate-binding protein|nr:extracellular solute-binding protein [Spirochaetia bacterium]